MPTRTAACGPAVEASTSKALRGDEIMPLIHYAPNPVLTAADRVLAVAPDLTWRWRYAIFLEMLMRQVSARAEPGWSVWLTG